MDTSDREQNLEMEQVGGVEDLPAPPPEWGIDPTLVTFFVPLLQPLGLPHGSTYTLGRDEVVPWLVGTAIRVKEELPPLEFEDGRNYVSLMIWRPKEQFELPVKPLDAASKVMSLVTGYDGESLDDDVNASIAPPQETGGTVISAVTPLLRQPAQDLEQAVSKAFDQCLQEMGLLIRAYAVQADDTTVPFLSRRNVYPIIPYALRNPFQEAPPRHELGALLVHEGVGILSGPPVELDQRGIQALATRVSRIKQGDLFHVASEQMHRASRAYLVEGDFAGAVSATFTAGEVMLNTVLLLMEWEKGTPREVTRLWFEEEGLVKRLRSYYHSSLGGNWNPSDDKGVIGQWYRLAQLRGRVVHAGYQPNEDEVRAALSTTSQLMDFVKDRVVAKRNIFPRTTLLLLGEPGLRRRNAWGGSIERFARDQMQHEPPWIKTFRAWLDGVSSSTTPSVVQTSAVGHHRPPRGQRPSR